MATKESLLQAIINAPNDDAPRIAYANFIEKNGDSARADFIRVQCVLDKMRPDSPERQDLAAREKELLERHGWDWADEFGREISQWVFRRGFIERIEMCLETSAEQILSVLSKAPIRHVRDISQFCDFDGVVDALPCLERLTGLEFWCLYAFEDSQVAEILASPHLRNLRTLILHHDRNGNLVNEKVLIDALASPYRANLEELGVNIDGCWRGPSTGILKAMAQSPHLRKLQKLNITNAGDEGNQPAMALETARLMGNSPNFAELQALDMGSTSFPIEVWDEVLNWPWLNLLKWLRLHYSRQVKAPDLFYTVAELKDLPKYRTAFEERVETIDWETKFISPWDENTCWRGLSWQDRPKRLLFGMNRFVRARDYEGLESEYRRLCEELSGEQPTMEIDELKFDQYEKKLHKGLKKALGLAAKKGKAVFLRMRPDIEWKGDFHVQAADPGITEPCEEFSYAGPVKEYSGPQFNEAAKIFNQFGLYSGTKPNGAALYVLARTVAAFGRCLNEYSVSMPVYFSCMYAVFCMKGNVSTGAKDDETADQGHLA